MAISTDYHLIPYENGGSLMPPQRDFPGRHPASRETVPSRGGRSSAFASSHAFPAIPKSYRIYTTLRTLEAPSRPATGLVVDIFV